MGATFSSLMNIDVMKVTLSLSKGSRDESMIRMRFTIPNSKVRPEISTGIKVAKRLWCSRTQQVSLNAKLLATHGLSKREATLMNQQLHQAVAELSKLITARSLESYPSPPNPIQIKAEYVAMMKGEALDTSTQLDLIEAFDEYVQRPNLSAGTVKNLIQTRNKVQGFHDTTKASLKIEDINHNWLLQFATVQLQGKTHAPLSKHTVSNHIKRIKTVVDALESHYPKAPDLRKKLALGETKKVRKPVLTREQIQSIRDHDFSSHTLNRTRDWFVIQCWTGLRVSDLLELSSDMIMETSPGEWEIHHVQNKTNHLVEIPVHPDAAAVLTRLKGLPRKMNKAHYAREIKKLCRIIGLDQNMEGYLPKPVKGPNGETYMRSVLGTYPMWRLISTHTARRTAATNYLLDGAREVDVMSLTGHRTARQLYEYLHSTPAQHKSNLKMVW